MIDDKNSSQESNEEVKSSTTRIRRESKKERDKRIKMNRINRMNRRKERENEYQLRLKDEVSEFRKWKYENRFKHGNQDDFEFSEQLDQESPEEAVKLN
jgi:DNA polymerase III delta prime subunit